MIRRANGEFDLTASESPNLENVCDFVVLLV